jgi:hypothetical protein
MYNATALSPGPTLLPHTMRAILTKRLTFRGFIVSDFAARYGDFMRDVSVWVGEGRIKHREDVVEGLENAPRLLTLGNRTRQIARSRQAAETLRKGHLTRLEESSAAPFPAANAFMTTASESNSEATI